jgi:hypothetical protein
VSDKYRRKRRGARYDDATNKGRFVSGVPWRAYWKSTGRELAPVWREMTADALAVRTDMLARMNGLNGGRFGWSYSSSTLVRGERQIIAALCTLIRLGFVERLDAGGIVGGRGRSAAYRVSNLWEKYDPADPDKFLVQCRTIPEGWKRLHSSAALAARADLRKARQERAKATLVARKEQNPPAPVAAKGRRFAATRADGGAVTAGISPPSAPQEQRSAQGPSASGADIGTMIPGGPDTRTSRRRAEGESTPPPVVQAPSSTSANDETVRDPAEAGK